MARDKVREWFRIDPAHERLKLYDSDNPESLITHDIWRTKYRWGNETHPFDTVRRVVEGVYAQDPDRQAKQIAYEAMERALWIPGGRIIAGAGTPNRVTLLNCYMCRDIHDSMEGIADSLKDAMLTMQQGGGIGMNFSTLRPSGAYLHRTGAVASGPLPFMDMWDSMCATIMSAGSRRGAMMAVMHCEHPDLVRFVTAKQQPGRLTNFNVSVLATDAFMDAVANDEEWYLGFGIPRADGKHLFVTERDDEVHQGQWYAYEKWRARDLWNLITQNTYEWSEPGIIFIDRINSQNNLAYCETITGTNPCGEQPLPPNGCCNLGAVNLARMVMNPFSHGAQFDFGLLKQVASVGMRFLDNVIEVTGFPLYTQSDEEFNKRRTGMGITGLANCLEQLGMRYGSPEAVEMTDKIMQTLANEAYAASAMLAKERGPFPMYNAELWGRGNPVVRDLNPSVKAKITRYGIRNGVILTIAPTGTTSLFAGNISSGLEPVFLHTAQRMVRQADDSRKAYTIKDYGVRLYRSIHGDGKLPAHMVTHEGLTVTDHIRMQAACQRWIDASVSKTINCPQAMTLEDFRLVYEMAWELGCKGCTTYRYSATRDSVLSTPGQVPLPAGGDQPRDRPEALLGHTYKVKWPSVDENYYITINEDDFGPFEMFIQSTSSKYADWTTALSLMISAIMRQGIDVSFIPEELQKVISIDDACWVEGKFYGSLVALIGHTIGKHIKHGDISSVKQVPSSPNANPQPQLTVVPKKNQGAVHGVKGSGETVTGASPHKRGEICNRCNMPTVFYQEGCKSCTNCGYSNCG